MLPSFKSKGKYAIWTHLGPQKLSSIKVCADGEVKLLEVKRDEESDGYIDLPEVSGIPAIRYAEDYIGNDFMKLATEAMQ